MQLSPDQWLQLKRNREGRATSYFVAEKENSLGFAHALCITDLDKLKLIWQFDISLKPSFATPTVAFKITTPFSSGQKWPIIIILLFFTKVQYKFLIYTVALTDKDYLECFSDIKKKYWWLIVHIFLFIYRWNNTILFYI